MSPPPQTDEGMILKLTSNEQVDCIIILSKFRDSNSSQWKDNKTYKLKYHAFYQVYIKVVFNYQDAHQINISL